MMEVSDIPSLVNAIETGDLVEIRRLALHSEIDVNRPDERGLVALNAAANNGFTEAVEILLKNPNIDSNKLDSDGGTPLNYASHEGHVEIVRLLLKHPKVNTNEACENG
eukprot:132116_1